MTDEPLELDPDILIKALDKLRKTLTRLGYDGKLSVKVTHDDILIDLDDE